MARADDARFEVQKLMRAVPFQPFTLVLESGERVVIEHPENIAFKPAVPGGARVSGTFHAISGDDWVAGNFAAVTAVIQSDRDSLAS